MELGFSALLYAVTKIPRLPLVQQDGDQAEQDCKADQAFAI